MKKISLISDTHSHLAQDVIVHLEEADEVWHAGDVGSLDTVKKLEKYKLRMVYGNIDGAEVRVDYPKDLVFEVEDVRVYMTHIGGYPGRYTRRAYEMITRQRPAIFISGHSHILKVMKDKKLNLLHMNPGACGIVGFHKFRTMIKFELDNGKIQHVEAVDFGLRGRTSKSQSKESE